VERCDKENLNTPRAIIEVGCVYLADPRIDQFLRNVQEEADVGPITQIMGHFVQVWVHTVTVVVATLEYIYLLSSEVDLDGRTWPAPASQDVVSARQGRELRAKTRVTHRVGASGVAANEMFAVEDMMLPVGRGMIRIRWAVCKTILLFRRYKLFSGGRQTID